MRDYNNIDSLLARAIEGRKLTSEEKETLISMLYENESFNKCFYDMLVSYCETKEYDINLKIITGLCIAITAYVSVHLVSIGINTEAFTNYLLRTWLPTALGSLLFYNIAKYISPAITVSKDLFKFRHTFKLAYTTIDGIANANLHQKLIQGMISALEKDCYVAEKIRYTGYAYDTSKIRELINEYQTILDLYDISYSEKVQERYSKLNETSAELLEEVEQKERVKLGDDFDRLYNQYSHEYDNINSKRFTIKKETI